MMTAIQILQAVGLVAVALLARAALIIGVVALLAIPLVAYAYAVRAAEGFWHRHHALQHVHHHG